MAALRDDVRLSAHDVARHPRLGAVLIALGVVAAVAQFLIDRWQLVLILSPVALGYLLYLDRQGSLVFGHLDRRTDLLFITLQKADKDYSPTTRYLDYAINEHLFHWETQAKVTVASTLGQNYIHHEQCKRSIALFIRLAPGPLVAR